MAASRAVGIAVLVFLVVAAELVAMPEARLIQRASAGGAVTGDGESDAGLRRPSKWNRGRVVLGGEKRSVPGGPDPQHHN
ncbi:hypothetical protein BDA96_09G207000 [Sorghum bicolor]|jgi:hypothetical protein|uniref:Uncharacterized protein n=2 Tax=Sorghum bicolor TaxID=4558 RepID=A0A921U591_SORBI|nr:hypothetical protein BDA96_09G207000 [Sorghum bicolor]KXG22341.1 hypothetical protein SORBI_3009G196500 [Sorghum bicolor]